MILMLMLVADLHIVIQGGKSGAGYDEITISADGTVIGGRKAMQDSALEVARGRVPAADAAKLLERAKFLTGLKDEYENDRSQSHWNHYVVELGTKRISLEGGSTRGQKDLAPLWALIEAAGALAKTVPAVAKLLRWF